MRPPVEGLGPLADRTVLDGCGENFFAVGELWASGNVLVSAKAAAKARALAVARRTDVRASPEGVVCTPGVSMLACFGGGEATEARAAAAEPATFAADERDVGEVAGLPLRIADAWMFGVDHWSELLWANLLAIGPFLWAQLASNPLALGWAGLCAGSFRPERIAGRLVQQGTGSFVHPRATVEFSVLGNGVRVGAGAVVRGCVLGEGAVVEELAMVEGCVVGAEARIQRQAMAKYSVVESGAAHAGVIQLGVLGAGAAVRQGAVLFDQSLGAPVRILKKGKLEPAPHGLIGVCIGPGAVIGQGVRIAAGRAIPAGVTVLPSAEGIVVRTEFPEGAKRVRVSAGGLIPE